MLALNVMSGYNLLNECVKYLKEVKSGQCRVELLKMMKISAALARPDHGPTVMEETLAAEWTKHHMQKTILSSGRGPLSPNLITLRVTQVNHHIHHKHQALNH